jgi:hypothetical protein
MISVCTTLIRNEVDLFEHPNHERYLGQKISVVVIENYAYLVPFVESGGRNLPENYHSQSQGYETRP